MGRLVHLQHDFKGALKVMHEPFGCREELSTESDREQLGRGEELAHIVHKLVEGFALFIDIDPAHEAEPLKLLLRFYQLGQMLLVHEERLLVDAELRGNLGRNCVAKWPLVGHSFQLGDELNEIFCVVTSLFQAEAFVEEAQPRVRADRGREACDAGRRGFRSNADLFRGISQAHQTADGGPRALRREIQLLHLRSGFQEERGQSAARDNRNLAQALDHFGDRAEFVLIIFVGLLVNVVANLDEIFFEDVGTRHGYFAPDSLLMMRDSFSYFTSSASFSTAMSTRFSVPSSSDSYLHKPSSTGRKSHSSSNSTRATLGELAALMYWVGRNKKNPRGSPE